MDSMTHPLSPPQSIQPTPSPRGICYSPAVSPRHSRFSGVGANHVQLLDGQLSRWQQRNLLRTIPHVVTEIREAGNLSNLRSVSIGGNDAVIPFKGHYPFLDTDVYKVLEGLAYELARTDHPSPDFTSFWEEAVSLIQSAQRPDGYLNSYFQSPQIGREPWSDLAWGHELYSLGHLIQAGLAADRQLADDRLLTVAIAFADLAVSKFGPDGTETVCGHPEVEMALVELYRHTGRADYLELARLFIERRGHRTIADDRMPAEYFQDAVPLRDLDSITGHAVRMMYLAAGATDVAIETADQDLFDSLERLWRDMVRHKMYITGGLGSRHSDEAIGDRFELPSDRSYAETCAAIATMQWAWRMFLATGEAHYLDAYEQILYNAYAAGISADGTAFFYDNPLQRRPDHRQRSGAETDGEELRRAWFSCPCCPPNVARWTAELQDHIAVLGDHLTIAVLTGCRIQAGGLDLEIDTEYPWQPRATIRVHRADPDALGLRLRVPGWCEEATVSVVGRALRREASSGWFEVDDLVSGDVIEITLPMPVQQHAADPRVDALRAQTCFTRGPIVFCAEQIDQGQPVDEIVVGPDAGHKAEVGFDEPVNGQDGFTAVLDIPARNRVPRITSLYPVISPPPWLQPGQGEITVRLIPYHLWANRGPGAMRVWLPTARDQLTQDQGDQS